MKRLFTAFAVAILVSCAKSAPETTASSVYTRPSQSTAMAAGILENTGAHRAETILAAAATLAKSNQPLGAAPFERCWKDDKRPEVREACFLAASLNTAPPDQDVIALIHGMFRGAISRNQALAILRWTGAIELLDQGELVAILDALKGDPPWTRARAVDLWTAKSFVISDTEISDLWNRINLPHEAQDPYSLSEGYRVAVRFGTKLSFETNYCPGTALQPFAMLRCYRFLSTLVDPRTKRGLPEWLEVYLPHRYDDNWKVFQENYPDRAALLPSII